jgi:hypothetical protein
LTVPECNAEQPHEHVESGDVQCADPEGWKKKALAEGTNLKKKTNKQKNAKN